MSLYGADISNHQGGHELWPLVDAGHRFVILKATEGATYRDQFMAAWRADAHAAGMFVGLYHFNRANDPAAEIANFMEHTGGLYDNEFAVADWEDGASPEQVRAWLEGVEHATGRRPVLYSYAPYLEARPTGDLTRWPLWIAAYGPNDGAEHPPPRTDRWTPFADAEGNALGPGSPPFEGRTIMWQFTSNGTVANWDGRLDLNRFDGTTADLAALCGGSAPVPVPPTPARVATHGWREIHSFAEWELGDKAAFPTPAQSYAGSHASLSWHKVRDVDNNLGCAVDYGDANSDPLAVFNLFRPFAVPDGPCPELIYGHVIIKEGVESIYYADDHGDHCHVAVRPAGQFPVDANPGQPAHPSPFVINEEEAMYVFGLPNGGGLWLAWAGKRYHISTMEQVEDFRRAGVPIVSGDFHAGAAIPVGA